MGLFSGLKKAVIGAPLSAVLGSKPKTQSPEELLAQQEAAARAERDKLALQTAGQQAADMKKAAAAQVPTRTLAAGLIDEEAGRKKFLKGI